MSEKRIAEISALLDTKAPKTALGHIVLESYGDGAGLLATTPDVNHARALFELAARAELEAHNTASEAERTLVVSA